MFINPDINKQAQEAIFSCKYTILNQPTIFFNESPVAHTSSQKHLRMHLGEKLKFNTHIKGEISKANKGLGIIRKLAHVLPSK